MADPSLLIPSTEALLADPRLDGAVGRLGRALVQEAVLAARAEGLPAAELVPTVLSRLPAVPATLRPVLNATGELIRDDLGRAPLSVAARAAALAAAGTADVELDLATGASAGHGRGVAEALVAAVPGAGAGWVTASGAAALLLAAVALAPGGEVAVDLPPSGDLGGAAVAELLASVGVRVAPVGPDTALLITGPPGPGASGTGASRPGVGGPGASGAGAGGPGTPGPDAGGPGASRPGASGPGAGAGAGGPGVSGLGVSGPGAGAGAGGAGVSGAGSGGGMPVVVVLPGGLLAASGVLPGEADAASALAGGAGLVVADADRLLGGPRAGIVVGRAALVDRMRAHPLAGALRVGKLTLAALEATLRGPAVPVARFLAAPADAVRARADRLATLLAASGVDATAVDTTAAGLPSAAVSLPGTYGELLRAGDPAVLGRPEGGRWLLDLRTVEETDDRAVQRAVLAASRVS